MWPTVEPQDQAKEFDLGFGPILNWLRVIGIELKYDQSNRCRIVFIFYQIGLFLGCISLHFSNIVELFVSTEGFEVWVEEKVHTDTFRMVSKGDVINTFILAEGTHILLIIPLRSRWRNLWRSMQELRQLMASNFNDRLRRMNLIGIAYIILSMVMLWAAYLYIYIEHGEMHWADIVTNMLINITLIYSPSATILFCLVVKTASNQFGQIRQKLTELVHPDEVVGRIEHLKRCYFNNVDLIRQIDQCFGTVLLLQVLNGVMGIIIEIIYLIVGNDNSNLLVVMTSFFLLNLHFTNIFTITFVVESMKKEANLLLRELNYRLHFKPAASLEESEKSSIASFITLMDHTRPRISAAGFFEVGQSLLRMLLSGIITFVFLFYEFYSKEAM